MYLVIVPKFDVDEFEEHLLLKNESELDGIKHIEEEEISDKDKNINQTCTCTRELVDEIK